MFAKSLQRKTGSHDLREYLWRERYAWEKIARKGQIPPDTDDWFCYFMRSGRGGGKTRSGAEWILKRVRQGFRNIGLIGETKADVRDVMVELGPSSILQICRPDERPEYEPSKRRLVWPNGAVATIYSGDEPDQLRGPAHDTIWIDELAKFKYPEETWDNMEFGLRLGDRPQVFVTTTPKPIKIIKTILADPRTIDIRFSTFDNIENLSPAYIERMKLRYEGTRLGRQELEGEILDDNPEALWRREVIEATRVRKAPALYRIVIGVDPAVTSLKDSSETGIVAAGIAGDGHCYILGDYSIRDRPDVWAGEVVKAFRLHRADRVIGEVNQGGDLVEANIRTVDRTIPFTAVHASRGKKIRAEPIAGLYEQGRVHHLGAYPELEDQLCEWVPSEQKSPDRLDALVWALSELTENDLPGRNAFPVVGGTRKW